MRFISVVLGLPNNPGRGVTANMSALGADDSGFESLRPDKKVSKKFQKNVEDFVCEKCGFSVKGTGFTNHCPQCLWSKHVDIHPGDRLAECGGLMEPVGMEAGGGKYSIIHKCVKCGHQKKNRVEQSDNFDKVIDITKKLLS